MDRDQIKVLRDAMNVVLGAIAPTYGLKSINVGNAKFGGSHVTFQVECVEVGGESKEVARYNELAPMLKLPPLGWVFSHGVRSYKTTGLSPTAAKVHVSRVPDGRGFLVPLATVVNAYRATP